MSSIKVSVSQGLKQLLHIKIDDWSQIYPNFILQTVVKKEMKIKMSMEGTVNGHHFKIVGEGDGTPFE